MITVPTGPKLYGTPTMAGIFEAHGIADAKKRDLLHRSLEVWGRTYLATDRNDDTRPNPGAIRAALVQLRTDGKALAEALRTLDFETDGLIARAAFQLTEEARRDKNAPMRKIKAYWEFPYENDIAASFLTPEQILTSLDFLGLVCERAESSLPTGRAGRKRLSALNEWAGHVGRFWRNELGRKFTVDNRKGEGLTPAFAFLRDCLKPIDPPAVKSLPAAMVKLRTEFNRGRKAPR